MYQPLEDALTRFGLARDDLYGAIERRDAQAVAEAYHTMSQVAEAVFVFLGWLEPYECGECDNCKANAAARRAEMQAAVDADPEFAGKHDYIDLSTKDALESDRLLRDALDNVRIDPDGGDIGDGDDSE